MSETQQTVLVTGGSGYAGQFLVHALAKFYNVHYTYGTRKLVSVPSCVVAHKVDLATGEGLREAFEQTPFTAVVNCAAISQPGVCESAPDKARAVNVPGQLVECLLRQERERGLRAALIHFSTDQVYDGSHALWREEEQCGPVNVYGKTKLEAEQYILSTLPESFPAAVLRSSIIYGPPPPETVGRALFLQFVASAVRGDKPTAFFADEWRSPVYVRDLERLVGQLIATASAAGAEATAKGPSVAEKGAGEGGRPTAGGLWRHRVFNMGGPERLSRADMARQVADALGCGHGAIQAVSAASVNRGVASPADISMDVGRLAEDLGFRTTSFREALREIFPARPPTPTTTTTATATPESPS